MRRELVPLAGSLACLADLVTTKIGLGYPELVEMNPWAHPIAEAVTVIVGQTGILKLGDKWTVNPKITDILALMPASVPLIAAINNLVLIAMAHAKLYPFAECPILYPEAV